MSLFFWQSMERQVIIQGIATKLPPEASDQYFQSRPRGSQLGAHVSNQSEVIESRSTLEKRLKSLEDQYKNQPIPRPTTGEDMSYLLIRLNFGKDAQTDYMIVWCINKNHPLGS